MNHVDQPHAKLLKEAGWEWETERVRVAIKWADKKGEHIEWELRDSPYGKFMDSIGWLPAPNLGELLDPKILTWDDFIIYYCDSGKARDTTIWENNMVWYDFAKWLYETMKDPNALARIWVWKERKK
ncbi:MAG: hypothetical protein PHC68_00440 [Syntrophorhabdaceae bacterium]|nr:hypothetical protein [Syntrophorhabdaceae bacterium]